MAKSITAMKLSMTNIVAVVDLTEKLCYYVYKKILYSENHEPLPTTPLPVTPSISARTRL